MTDSKEIKRKNQSVRSRESCDLFVWYLSMRQPITCHKGEVIDMINEVHWEVI